MNMTLSKASTLPAGLVRAIRPAQIVILVVALGLLLAAPSIGVDGFTTRTITLVAILSLLTSGLNIVLGYAGELAVNQVFLYAVGAYVAAYLGNHLGIREVLLILPLVILAAVLTGLVSGVPGLRLGGWSLAMVTFFMIIILPNVVTVLEPLTGGTLGVAVPFPTFFGNELTGNGVYVLVVGIAISWFAITRNLVLSTHGTAFLVLRQSPILAESLGISVFRLKLTVYVIGAVPCAIAGALFAWVDGYIAPDTFTFALAISVLAASLFGGATSIYGAILGAFLLQYGQNAVTAFQAWELIIYGLFLLAAALVLTNGLAGVGRSLVEAGQRRGVVPRFAAATPLEAQGLATVLDPLPGRTVTSVGISKHFGGTQALSNVSLRAEPGHITALIGPNGSGKTTLLNLMCGFYTPSDGRITLGDDTISSLKPFRVAREGVARTFQTPLAPKGISTRDLVSAGAYTRSKSSMAAAVLRLPSYRAARVAALAEAMRLLDLMGIADVADTPADELPLGTRRLAEVARAVAAHPSVFLFDEVASGLDPTDLENLERAIFMIRDAGATVILVEHNFPLVLRVSNVIHVLSRGEVIASGTSAEIQHNPRVLEEYTGKKNGAVAIDDLEATVVAGPEEE